MKVSLILIKQRSDSAFRKIYKWHIEKKCLTKCVGELKLRQGRAKFRRISDKKDKKTGSLLTTLWVPQLNFLKCSSLPVEN